MKVKKGDKVKVEYEGKLENGEVFDSSNHGDHSHPLEFTVGDGMVIKGFDVAIEGMEVGEEKEITLKPEDAYGDKNPDLKKDFPRDMLPKEREPEKGMVLMMGTPDGRQIPVEIVDVDKDKIVVDLNHPLAGKTLIFKVKVVEIMDDAQVPTEDKEESLEDAVGGSDESKDKEKSE